MKKKKTNYYDWQLWLCAHRNENSKSKTKKKQKQFAVSNKSEDG